MELTEKLNIFYTSVIEVAGKRSSDEIEEFQAAMDKQLEDFRKRKQEEETFRYQVEEEKQKRQVNRQVSEAAILGKRKLNQAQQAKKETLFGCVEEKLLEFKKTRAYDEYLRSGIRMAKQFARDEEITIYLNPTDAEKKEQLMQETGCALTVSDTDFGGGIRAVVPGKNVLIDESFQTKLQKEREAYTF